MRLCVFCGSRAGDDPQYAAAAVELGVALVRRGIGVVYGGGRVGLMGVVADATLQAGGEVIGVIPDWLADREVAHQGLSELYRVESMHDRKALMSELSAGFIALPGGFGTLEEFCEVITWSQLGLHNKPCGLLNVGGYFDPLIRMFDSALERGFITPESRRIVIEGSTPDDLISTMSDWLSTAAPAPASASIAPGSSSAARS
ncbi:MAG: TIGR00730 family Rossman fold protein [Candidatus Eremiobacteraeota bacterium]|nr:TIGR00730 family Rossman fold protein [Candidatus Eremiobacteraeota bacterium]MBV8354449.1 TIGR00730 family Rossman fold protein [Candidatus Eremiobacteraeota bacterium]